MSSRKLAIVTGASSGIGLEIAKLAAQDGYDLIVAADTPFVEAGPAFQNLGADVEEVETDLSTKQGVDQLLAKVGDRPVDVLVANAGHGLGHAFLDQSPEEWQHVLNTDVTGTLLLVQPIVKRMVERGEGKVLITGSIAGFTPGSFQAVYNASKSYLNSLSFALREELRDTDVTVTCLMPGATETEFFKRADMMDTMVGTEAKDDAAMVAREGFDAMMKDKGDVVTGTKNKVQSAIANVMPSEALAKQHRKMAEPGTAK